MAINGHETDGFAEGGYRSGAEELDHGDFQEGKSHDRGSINLITTWLLTPGAGGLASVKEEWVLADPSPYGDFLRFEYDFSNYGDPTYQPAWAWGTFGNEFLQRIQTSRQPLPPGIYTAYLRMPYGYIVYEETWQPPLSGYLAEIVNAQNNSIAVQLSPDDIRVDYALPLPAGILSFRRLDDPGVTYNIAVTFDTRLMLGPHVFWQPRLTWGTATGENTFSVQDPNNFGNSIPTGFPIFQSPSPF